MNICECLEHLEPSHQTHQSLKRLEPRLSLLNSHLYLSDWAKLFWILLFTEKTQQKITRKKKTHTHTSISSKVNQFSGSWDPRNTRPCGAVCHGSSRNYCSSNCDASGCGNDSSTGNRCGKGVGASWLYGFLVAWCSSFRCFWWFLKGFLGNCLFHCLAVFLSFLHWCHCSSIG